jgi:hypothetical protein
MALSLADVHRLITRVVQTTHDSVDIEGERASTSTVAAVELGMISEERGALDVTGQREESEFRASEEADVPDVSLGQRGRREPSASVYDCYEQGCADTWFEALRQSEKCPNPEQWAVLEDIRLRCELEASEASTDTINETSLEPTRMMIQGLPGAGKSQVIKWIREFFDQVLGWTHGSEYVCIASMNTMAALIGGFTIHSFGMVPVSQQHRDAKHQASWNKPEMNPMFERCQNLRWVLVDETSSASAEILAILARNLRDSIRKGRRLRHSRTGTRPASTLRWTEHALLHGLVTAGAGDAEGTLLKPLRQGGAGCAEDTPHVLEQGPRLPDAHSRAAPAQALPGPVADGLPHGVQMRLAVLDDV